MTVHKRPTDDTSVPLKQRGDKRLIEESRLAKKARLDHDTQSALQAQKHWESLPDYKHLCMGDLVVPAGFKSTKEFREKHPELFQDSGAETVDEKQLAA